MCPWSSACLFNGDEGQPRQEITITLPDGSQRKGTSWETSPLDIAKGISQGLADRTVIAKVRAVTPFV